jgi:uncharacterized membrane protein YgdD (TMEM256/DUF423 family)
MNKRTALMIGALAAGLAVAFGAFGSHALKTTLMQAGRADTFETAVRYQMYHALALLWVSFLMSASLSKNLSRAAVAFTVGIILFSGSLYVLCLHPVPGIVYLTPLGGVFFIIGWVLVFIHAIAKR